MEVEVKGKKVQIKELSYVQSLELSELSKSEMARQILKLGTDLEDGDIETLTISEGIELQNAINIVNKLEDFQKPAEETK